jgi:stage II sporulation protein R
MKKIEKAILCGMIIAILVAMVSDLTAFAQQCDEIRGSCFRLHILANSDSVSDQNLKLKVRDKILSGSSEIFTTATNKNQAIAEVRKNLDKIKEIAQNEVYSEGYKYTVNVELVNMYFTTRTYGDITLPAGDYDAVRVLIGTAKGHNWWCVMFPPLCLPSAVGTVKLDKVLNKKQSSIVKGNNKPQIQIKFKVVEIYEGIVNYFRKK